MDEAEVIVGAEPKENQQAEETQKAETPDTSEASRTGLVPAPIRRSLSQNLSPTHTATQSCTSPLQTPIIQKSTATSRSSFYLNLDGFEEDLETASPEGRVEHVGFSGHIIRPRPRATLPGFPNKPLTWENLVRLNKGFRENSASSNQLSPVHTEEHQANKTTPFNHSSGRVNSTVSTSKMNTSSKRSWNDDNDGEESTPSKRQRQEHSIAQVNTPTPAPRAQPSAGIFGSITRMGNSISKRIFGSTAAKSNGAAISTSPQPNSAQASSPKTSSPVVTVKSNSDSAQKSPLSENPVGLSEKTTYSLPGTRNSDPFSEFFLPPSTRSPSARRSRISRTRNSTPATSRQATAAEKIIAKNPNYTPRTPQQIEERLHSLRYPPGTNTSQNLQTSQNPNTSEKEQTETGAPRTDVTSSNLKKRKHTPGPGSYMAAAYVNDGDDGYIDYYGPDSDSGEGNYAPTPRPTYGSSRISKAARLEPINSKPSSTNTLKNVSQTPSTPSNTRNTWVREHTLDQTTLLRSGQPRSALKKTPSTTPVDHERSAKRVKFGSPIESAAPRRTVGLARNRKFGAYNLFVDDDLSQANNQENSQVESETSQLSDNSLLRQTQANTLANTPRNIFMTYTPSTPNAPSNQEEDFTPRPHNPTPSTFCLPDDFDDSLSDSSIIDESMMTDDTQIDAAVTKARSEAEKHKPVTPSRLREVARAPTPVEEAWDFPVPQTYQEAGTISDEALKIINANWTEDDSEDAALFFQRGFARYCKQIDEYEAKGFSIEVDC
ncbi:MAG: hypothetical protein Q9227_001844 [Pyrenula ochraceoflavens]